jgi:uncharacterized protein YkwD
MAGLVVLAAALVSAPTAAAAVEQAVAIDVAATEGTPFSGPVASFKSTTDDPAAFTASVTWGDGSPLSAGTITALSFDPMTMLWSFQVEGSHTYATAGTNATAIEITQIEMPPSVVVNGTATVSSAAAPAPPPPPPPPPAALTPPTILSAGFSPRPRVGRLTVLRIRASAENAPVRGYVVNLGEPGGRFGAAACTLLPIPAGDVANPFLPGTATTFGLTYTFRRPGNHTITLAVTAGGCADEQTTTQQFTVTVPRKASAARAAAASAAQGTGWLMASAAQTECSDDLMIPDEASVEVVAAAVVCLTNAERARAGVPALAVDSRLVASATAHTRAMVQGRFFSHEGPSEPDLGARGAAADYRDGMGENIGFGTGTLSSAKSMLDAWMDSPPHRANILDPRYRGIGISVIANAPTGPPTPGASYTANFGTATPTGAPPPAAKPRAPSITVAVTPKAFRAAASGPSTSPAGRGARIRYVLNRSANVVFTVRRKVAGRRAGRRCVAPGRAKRTARKCVRTRRVGAFREQGTAGVNVLRFSGRLNGRRLAPGAYLLVAVSTDATGRRSKPRSLSFRILPGRA